MSGGGEGKTELKGAKVYIHVKGKSGARITHIDIEHDDINKIILPLDIKTLICSHNQLRL